MNIHKKTKKLLFLIISIFMLLAAHGIWQSPETSAAASKNGWVQSSGTWYYYQNGVMIKNGWAKDSHGWCFLNAIDGSWVQQGWAKDSHGWGYIQNGYWVEHEAWVRDSHGWCYMGKDGYWIDHSYYVYDSKGICIIGKDGYWTEERLPVGSAMPVAYINLDKTSSNIYIGDTDTLTAVIEPYNADDKNISWTSSNPSVASVDSMGEVTGVSAGNAVITAANSDGSVTANCTYTVQELPDLTIDQITENKDSIMSILAYDRNTMTSVEIGVNTLPMPNAIGSGTVISADGKVLTNYHLIEGASAVFAVTYDGQVYEADGLLGYDKSRDIAVIKLKDASNLPASIIGDSDGLKVTDKIVTIGHFIDSDDSAASALEGSISGINESVTTLRTGTDIKITSNIDQGYAGSGLYNMKGRLIGIDYAVQDGSSYVIPINEFKQLINGTTVTPISQLCSIYKAQVPEASEIKSLAGSGNGQEIDFQPFFYKDSRKINLSAINVYSGDQANDIVQSESTENSQPGSDKQWIVMNILMSNDDVSGDTLQPYQVLLDNFFNQDGTSLPVYEIAEFNGERAGNNITDVSLDSQESASFWFGILVDKTEELPLLRVASGYDPDTLQTAYSWYSLK